MKKEFIPYEQALELKELGFKEWCFGIFPREQNEEFTPKLNYIGGISTQIKFEQSEFQTLAPIFSQAFRWFRKMYGLYHSITNNVDFGTERNQLDSWYYVIMVDELFHNDIEKGYYLTYEETELACLKKLIEIVKNI